MDWPWAGHGTGSEAIAKPPGGTQRRVRLGPGEAPRVCHPAPNPPTAAPTPAGVLAAANFRPGASRKPPVHTRSTSLARSFDLEVTR